MAFTQEFIDQVREANDVVEVIGQYTELKRSGARLMGRCPFPDHSDKSPSFSVTEDNQLYFCYGCKKGGNLYTFLTTYNGMSFPEAVEYLARKAGIPIPEDKEKKDRPSGASRDQKDLLLKTNKAAAVFYYQQLKAQPADSPVRRYLDKRGLSAEIVEKFRLGVALDEWQGLLRHLRGRNFPQNALETLGLIKPKKNQVKGEESHFDLFRNRLMFPIFSPTDEVLGFGGRTLGDDIAKYVNSSDSPIFNKSRILYGIHETGKFIRTEGAVVVEGYMDALSLYAAGIKNVVAIMGTAFTHDHAKLLKRYTTNVTMLLDGDDAGITGAERSLPILLEFGLMPKGLLLPEKMDPDDYIRTKGAQALKDDISRAPELFSLLRAKRWMVDYQGQSTQKVQIMNEAAEALRGMKDRSLQELYMVELAQELDVDVSWVRRSLIEPPKQGPASRPKPIEPVAEAKPEAPPEEAAPPMQISVKGAPKQEGFILSLLLHSEQLMASLIDAGTEDLLEILSHDGVKEMIKCAVQLYKKEPGNFAQLAADMATRVDKPAIVTCALSVLPEDRTPELENRLMGDYMKSIQVRFLKREARELEEKLRQEKNPSPELLQQFMNLQRNRLSLVDREEGAEEDWEEGGGTA